MELTFRARRDGEIEYGIIYGTIAALALAAARFLPVHVMLPPCAFRSAVGLPCPACGATRALVALARGDVGQALVLNPLLSLVVIAGLVLFFANVLSLALRLPRPSFVLTRKEGWLVRSLAAGAVLLNWMFLALGS
jgi:hypothetical protein